MNPSLGGRLALVLHAHLPFVRHPEHPVFLEENWFFEALAECYLPLLDMLDGLERDGVAARLTLSLSPPLLEMLADDLLRERFLARLDALVELCEKETRRLRHEPAFLKAAVMYEERFRRMRALFVDRCGRDVAAAFRHHRDGGRLELIACAGTHAFLPLMQTAACRRAHIRMGIRAHARFFGNAPAGMWLPECAYVPGLDADLAGEGIRFFFLDSHGILNGTPRPRYAIFAPVRCRSGAHAFGRDIASSKQVWSATSGYPGDADYREFYRDLGYDGDADYLAPYLHPDGIRHDLGLKYHRVTGDVPLHEKAPYDPEAAAAKADAHARHFLNERRVQMALVGREMKRPPTVVAPFDAELFGHWWFEGPVFLDRLLRRLADQDEVTAATPSDVLAAGGDWQVQEPSASSWGDKGYFEVWLNGANDWIYPRLHECERTLVGFARRFADPAPLEKRALDQAARELMLAQSSDWAFIMSTGTAVDYAQGRVREHLADFARLAGMVDAGRIDEAAVAGLERRNCLFPDMDFRLFAE